jgi:hypothetical protein
MLKIDFHRAGLTHYTGFKSSPYTEGALFYGEKLVSTKDREAISTQAEKLAAPKTGECAPGFA